MRKNRRETNSVGGAIATRRWFYRFEVLAILVLLTHAAAAQNMANPCAAENNLLAQKVFAEYGAMFAATDVVRKPPTCIFNDSEEVNTFQATLRIRAQDIGGVRIELQQTAMDALMRSVAQAAERGLKITPLDGEIAGRRSFADTVRIWNSRFIPAANYWVARRKITRQAAEDAMNMSVPEQVEQVLEWESRGLFFSTGKNRPIMSSVAPPGTSQHLSLLAFDIEQAGNRRVREILNRNGWYQTVVNDTPHFTYLGFAATELPQKGLISVVKNGYKFWIPKIR